MLEWLFGKKKAEPQKPKNIKSKQQSEPEDNWMYDFMVQFLSGPLWKTSILDFVDCKCIVFDDQEENKFQYTIIHNEFKQLVGNLVDELMSEVGMSEEKLAKIIQIGLESKQKKIFNQLLLADDFLRFKNLMVKRNKSLEQQAIISLQQSRITAFTAKSNQQKNLEQEQIAAQKRQYQKKQIKMQQQQQEIMIKKIHQKQMIESKTNEALKQLQKKATDPKVQQKQPEINHEKLSQKNCSKNKAQVNLELLKNSQTTSKMPQLKDLPPIKNSLHRLHKNSEQFDEPKQQKVQQIKQQKAEQMKQQTKVQTQLQKSKAHSQEIEQIKPSESIQARKKRLIAQRQKIQKQKQQQRKKQLEQQETENKQKNEIHTIVLQQDGFYDQKQIIKQQTVQNLISEQELKRRKQLMNKIKSRIVDDF